MAHIKMLPLGR